ncbi:MAG: general secretion pathway protein GspB [Desulfobacterales bacterium]|nr:general secretion pathway protein GspB [Desulfobacterales bacterium]
MSSILKALKRVEAESPPLPTYQYQSAPIDPKQALNSNTKKRWLLRRLIYLLLILVVIVGGAVVVFSQRDLLTAGLSFLFPPDPPPAGNRTGIYRAKIPTATPNPTQAQRQVTRRPVGQIKTPATTGRDKKFQARSTSANRRSAERTAVPRQAASALRSPQAKPKAKANPRPKQVARPASTASLKKPKTEKKPQAVRPAARRPQSVRPEPRQTYDRINDDKLRLQALAWAEDADRRMVVINDRIVHEGESVDGYLILKIREEDVIIQQGGKSWRLEFGLQQ